MRKPSYVKRINAGIANVKKSRGHWSMAVLRLVVKFKSNIRVSNGGTKFRLLTKWDIIGLGWCIISYLQSKTYSADIGQLSTCMVCRQLPVSRRTIPYHRSTVGRHPNIF